MERWCCGYGIPAMLSRSHTSTSKHVSECQYSSEGDCFLLLSECKTWATGTWSWRYSEGSVQPSARTSERGIFVRTCIVATWYRAFARRLYILASSTKYTKPFTAPWRQLWVIFRIAETTATNSVSVTSVKLQLVVLKLKELSVSGAEKSLRN